MEFRLAEWPEFEVPRMDGLPVTPSTKHPTSADTRMPFLALQIEPRHVGTQSGRHSRWRQVGGLVWGVARLRGGWGGTYHFGDIPRDVVAEHQHLVLRRRGGFHGLIRRCGGGEVEGGNRAREGGGVGGSVGVDIQLN
uniref:Uncharacterized protein n=1 Tax=Setaria italica TaxID=4555 RepID=K3ZK79_SETIT